MAVEENKGRQGVKTVHLSDRPRNKVNPSVDAPAWAGMYSFSLRKISYDGSMVESIFCACGGQEFST